MVTSDAIMTYGSNPSMKITKRYMWVVIGIYCVFSAIFWIWAVAAVHLKSITYSLCWLGKL